MLNKQVYLFQYISLAVITSLAFLGAVGGIVAISWQFGFFGLFRDSG